MQRRWLRGRHCTRGGPDPSRLEPSGSVVLLSRNPSMCQGMRQRLREQGVVAITAGSVRAAAAALGDAAPLAVVADATEGIGDQELLGAVQLAAGAPVLVLPASALPHPAVLEEPPDVGADPWTPGGVVHAQLAAAAMVTAALGEAVLRTERVELDVLRHEVRVDGMAVWFALKEFELLELLLRFRGRVLSSEFLLARVWGPEGKRSLHTLYVHIRRIRRKIEPDPKHPRYLVSPALGRAGRSP